MERPLNYFFYQQHELHHINSRIDAITKSKGFFERKSYETCHFYKTEVDSATQAPSQNEKKFVKPVCN